MSRPLISVVSDETQAARMSISGLLVGSPIYDPAMPRLGGFPQRRSLDSDALFESAMGSEAGVMQRSLPPEPNATRSSPRYSKQLRPLLGISLR